MASSGHKLGQIIGDWYEEYFALPILGEVAEELGLYIDSRFLKRDCRGEKIIWTDLEGNDVDYDFVFELNGNNEERGALVAAFETFWRRGSRHSKDKARDDTGKLMPLKHTYPTTRYLGIISAGDFTGPAKELVHSRGVDLFYVEKANIISAWRNNGVIIDYHDKADEAEKHKIATAVEESIQKDGDLLRKIAKELIKLINPASIKSYQQKLVGIIGAIPQSYSIQVQSKSKPIVFGDYSQVNDFLHNQEPEIGDFDVDQFYSYRVRFFDGDEFYRDNLSWEQLSELHFSLGDLVAASESRLEK